MIKFKKTSVTVTAVFILLAFQALDCLAWGQGLRSTLSPAYNLKTPSIQQSFKTNNATPDIPDQSLYKADFQKLKTQEQHAVQTIQRFSAEMSSAGSPIKTILRKTGTFKTETGNFSFDISGWPRMLGERDKENFYFRAGGLIVYNLWLENEAKAFLPSPISRPAILVPMQSSKNQIEDLNDQHLHQLWTASLLMAMQLAGEEQFRDKEVAIAGIGDGVDTILSLQLGAAKTHLFDYNVNLKAMFKTTLPYNTIRTAGVVDTKNIGKSFYDLSRYEPVAVDILLANLPFFGLQFLSEFLQFFTPKHDTMLFIISGANYSMLSDQEKKILEVTEKFKKKSQVIKIDYHDGEVQFNNEPLTYIYEFDRQAWTSQEMLNAVVEAHNAKPALPALKAIPSPSSHTNTITLRAI